MGETFGTHRAVSADGPSGAQLGATVGHAEHSGDLRKFIEQGKKIIVSTVQKFPFILDEISSEGGKSFAEFEVLRPIKGGVPRRVEIMSRSSPAACGVVFRQGEIVTVGAFFAEHQFSTNSCTQFSLRKR